MDHAIETSPHAFFFDSAAEGVPSYYGGVFDPAFLAALSATNSGSSLRSRVLRGDASIEASCVRITSVSKTVRHESWTQSYDKELCRTVMWDLADCFAHQWHTVNLEYFPLRLPGNRVHCIVLPSFPKNLREEVDKRLRDTLGYLGAAELDIGNPVQVALFLERLVDNAFIADGAVYLERNWEGINDTVFEGASSFSPGGERRLSAEEFLEQQPPLPYSSLSERGKISAERYEGKRTFTVEERVFNALSEFQNNQNGLFSFSLTADKSILQADVPEVKFIRYLLNPDHPSGGGKAKFFLDVLGIGQDDWRYLAAQFYEGLRSSEFSDLKIKTWTDEQGIGFGASFNCVLTIKGLNGRVARVLTNWILRPGQLPQLSTAMPSDKITNMDELAVAEPAVIASQLPQKERWPELYRLADEAGKKAAAQRVPTPMKISGFAVEMEGMCGGAYIRIPNARTGFARWVIRSDHGSRHYKGGAAIYAFHESQSVDRAVAYAEAFAAVLKLNGVECTVESFLD